MAASNLRGGSLSSSKERRRLLPASLGEAATSVGFAASMELKLPPHSNVFLMCNVFFFFLLML